MAALTVQEGDGVGADGVQSHRLFAVFGAAAFVFLFPPEEGPAGGCRQSLTGVFLHFCHAVSAVKLLVHPTTHRDTRFNWRRSTKKKKSVHKSI